MRELTADEREIVAGGWRSSDYLVDMLDEVVAWGRRSPWADMPYFYFYNPGGAGSASGGGGGDGDEPDTPRDTPCVTDKPAKHGNILDIHQAAIDLKEKMPYHHSLTPGEKFEYFGVVWKLPGGSVQTTEPETSELRNAVRASAVWEALDSIPDGAIILGIFHSQPDNGRMSDDDWVAHKVIFNNPDSPSMIARPDSYTITESIGRGITADPNGLSYVYDMKTGKIHVYDRSDMNSDKEQCHVNNVRGSR
jgi:hypothetical protein